MSVMESGAESNAEGGERESFEAYSDYENVSNRIGRKVMDAVDAFAGLQSAGAEQTNLDKYEYAQARANILSAALTLKVEIKREANREFGDDKVYTPVYERWFEGTEQVPAGYYNEFMSLSIAKTGGIPGWVAEFVEDIHGTAYRLGYLQAGRTVTEDDNNEIDKEVKDMYEGADFG